MKAIFELIWRHRWFFLLATAAGLALRLFFVFRYPVVAGDSFIYGDIAKNWLNHGIYGLSSANGPQPTLIRLPGYPGFLAVIFSLFGQEHYGAVMITEAFIDTNACLAIAALALELFGERTAKVTYLLAALCPFTANYTATPLTETLSIFCTAHGLYYGVRGLKALAAGGQGWLLWIVSGLWIAAGIYMRPDNLLVLPPLGLALFIYFLRSANRRAIIVATALLVSASLLPLAPWTVRNWRTFHVFQPLAPRYANDPGEFVPMGFNRWMKTWIVDYVSTEEVYWRVPNEPLDIDDLPVRAFDSQQQYEVTDELVSDYNQERDIDPEMDARFEALARERIAHSHFRYYAWLPFLRITNMWLRPRTELLAIETRWWEFAQHPWKSAFAIVWGALNLALVLAALRGWWTNQLGIYGIVLIGFVLLRSAFLGSLENPEPRYMLECFPVVLVLAGAAVAKRPT
ncbi:MAG TPA: glycosyltransferase family 39 protein [Candidatus Angelobacter sp.]